MGDNGFLVIRIDAPCNQLIVDIDRMASGGTGIVGNPELPVNCGYRGGNSRDGRTLPRFDGRCRSFEHLAFAGGKPVQG